MALNLKKILFILSSIYKWFALILRFRFSNPVIHYFEGSKKVYFYGERVTLLWRVEGAWRVKLLPIQGMVSHTGHYTETALCTKGFRLMAKGIFGLTLADCLIAVEQQSLSMSFSEPSLPVLNQLALRDLSLIPLALPGLLTPNFNIGHHSLELNKDFFNDWYLPTVDIRIEQNKFLWSEASTIQAFNTHQLAEWLNRVKHTNGLAELEALGIKVEQDFFN